MARPKHEDGLSKFQRYRAARQKSGMKLLRLWVPDTTADTFHAEAERQAALIRGTVGDVEAQRFIEQSFEWPNP